MERFSKKLLVENQELKKLLNGVNKIPDSFVTAKVISILLKLY